MDSDKIDTKLKQIISIISYFDSFDYPVTLNQLSCLLKNSKSEIKEFLSVLIQQKYIEQKDNFYYVLGKEWTIPIRKESENRFHDNIVNIYKMGNILSNIPFVRGLLLTGSASKCILNKIDDLDFLVITESNHLFLCMCLISLFKNVIHFLIYNKKSFPICCNYYIVENNLKIHDKNEFTAFEIFYTKPVFNIPLFIEFINKNRWIKKYYHIPKIKPLIKGPYHNSSVLKILLERIINLFISIFYKNKKLEQRLYHFAAWKKKDELGYKKIEEFKKHFTLNQVNWCKNDQAFMLQNLTQFKNNESRSKKITKILKHKYYFSESKRNSLFDIGLTRIDFSLSYKKEKGVKQNFFTDPLSIADYLERNGLKVYFYDKKFKNGLKNFKNLIIHHFIRVIGIYVQEESKEKALQIIKLCQSLDMIVIAFGPDPSNMPQFYIQNGVDIVIIGNIEQKLLEILQYIRNPNKPLSEIEGIYIKK